MVKVISGILLLALVAVAAAQTVGRSAGFRGTVNRAAAGGGGGPDANYYGVGSDSYPTVATYFWTGHLFGDDITVGAAGSLTKVAMKVQETSATAYSIRCTVWTGGGPWVMQECVTLAVTASFDGWVEATLVTPISVSSSQVVRVMGVIETAAGGNVGIYKAASSDGVKEDGRAYSDGCLATEPGSWEVAGEDPVAVRIYVD